jgi:hypothetical protein
MLRRRARDPGAIAGPAPHGGASSRSVVGAGLWRSRSSISYRRIPTSSPRRLIRWQVVTLGLVLVLVPPLLALAVEALVGLASRRLRAVLRLIFVALLVALIAIRALKTRAGTWKPGAGRGHRRHAAFHQAPVPAQRPHLGPPRTDRGHPPHDRRRARHPHAVARRRRVDLDCSARIPSTIEVHQAGGLEGFCPVQPVVASLSGAAAAARLTRP